MGDFALSSGLSTWKYLALRTRASVVFMVVNLPIIMQLIEKLFRLDREREKTRERGRLSEGDIETGDRTIES